MKVVRDRRILRDDPPCFSSSLSVFSAISAAEVDCPDGKEGPGDELAIYEDPPREPRGLTLMAMMTVIVSFHQRHGDNPLSANET